MIELFSENQMMLGGDTLTPEEETHLHARLWSLLAAQAKRKTQGDSSSLRIEDAQELLQSIQYTLSVHLQAQAFPVRKLLTENLFPIFQAAQKTLFAQVETTHRLYLAALSQVKTFDNRSLADTLAGIGQFFKLYDYRLYAHEIPADIDYQLCQPVPETYLGVSYIHEYLMRLLIENAMITRFDSVRVSALLARACPDHRDLLINLYEPVTANVLGQALIQGGLTLLEVTPTEAMRIQALFTQSDAAKANAMLRTASDVACNRLAITDVLSRQYHARTALSLYPRILASSSSAYGVFCVTGSVCNPCKPQG